MLFRFTLYIIIIALLSIILKYALEKRIMLLHAETIAIQNKTSQIILHHAQQHQQLLQTLNHINIEKKRAAQSNKKIASTLFEIATCLPNTITLNTLQWTKQKITITGIGTQLSDIHQYNTILQEKIQSKKAVLSDIQADKKNPTSMQFTLQVSP
jgi:Tfp pilus assembly protein PilN